MGVIWGGVERIGFRVKGGRGDEGGGTLRGRERHSSDAGYQQHADIPFRGGRQPMTRMVVLSTLAST